MTISGVGAVTAVSYIAAIEYPDDVANSHPVGACLGLTTRPYQSGNIDYDGHISRRGDGRLRGLLYEVATVHLTKTTVRTECTLKIWGLKLREQLGFKRTAVAVARKLAVIMHSMLNPRQAINPLAGAAAQANCRVTCISVSI